MVSWRSLLSMPFHADAVVVAAAADDDDGDAKGDALALQWNHQRTTMTLTTKKRLRRSWVFDEWRYDDLRVRTKPSQQRDHWSMQMILPVHGNMISALFLQKHLLQSNRNTRPTKYKYEFKTYIAKKVTLEKRQVCTVVAYFQKIVCDIKVTIESGQLMMHWHLRLPALRVVFSVNHEPTRTVMHPHTKFQQKNGRSAAEL